MRLKLESFKLKPAATDRSSTNSDVSVAERRSIFERMSTAKKSPPPKPRRTFAHDQYLSLKQISNDTTESPKTTSLSSEPTSETRQKTVERRAPLSHEYEQIFPNRPEVSTRNRVSLRRSLSDASVGSLGRNVGVQPLYYASNPCPSSPNNIYDTPKSGNSGKTPKRQLSIVSERVKQMERRGAASNATRSENPFSRTASMMEPDDAKLEEDSLIDKRVTRARVVRRQTLMHYDQQEMAFRQRRSPQLFELAVLIRLEPNDGSNPMLLPDQKYAPTVVCRYPAIQGSKPGSPMDTLSASLSCLCYPDITRAVLTSPETYKDEQFVMTITDQFGYRKFAYCYRFVPKAIVSSGQGTPAERSSSTERNTASIYGTTQIVLSSLPQVMCIVTPIQNAQFYLDLAREAGMKAKYALHNDMRSLREFLQECFWKPLPQPGYRLVIGNGSGAKQSVIVNRSSSCSLGGSGGLGISALIDRLGVDNAILLFTSLLSERRVLLVGDSVPAVSKAVQIMSSLLAPFEWPHTLVPVVPDPFVHLCFSPTPYFIGLLRQNLNSLKHLLLGGTHADDDEEYILIMDLDLGVLRDNDFNDQSSASINRFLPSKVARMLKQNVQSALTANGGADTKDYKVTQAFLTTFVELMGHYRDYLVTQQDGMVTFQKQQFINGTINKDQRMFLKWFTETGMFQVWMKKKLDAIERPGEASADALDKMLGETKHCQSNTPVVWNFMTRRLTSIIRMGK